MAPTYAACHAALGTAELLESILLYLPIKQIFLMQRVSKQWRAITLGSIQLQRALFFEPFDRDETKDKNSNDFLGPYLFIKPLLHFVGRTRRWGNDPVDVRIDFKNPGYPGLVEKHTKGSWRRMLFVQPAIRKLRMTCIFSHCTRQCVVSNDEGVTMEDIVQEARKHAEEYRCSHYEWYGDGSSLQHLGIFETEEDCFLEFMEHPTAAWALARIENAGGLALRAVA